MKIAYQLIHESLIDDDLSMLAFAACLSKRRGWIKMES